jgi:hypothetical protein
MFSCFRLVVACLMMIALPLQGLAAASMLFCGTGQAQHAAISSSDARASVGHDHAAHMHSAEQTHADAHQVQEGKPGSLPDAGHKCGVCAACCHGAAIAGFSATPLVPPPPQANLAEPFVLIHARAASVPDKPPRLTRV